MVALRSIRTVTRHYGQPLTALALYAGTTGVWFLPLLRDPANAVAGGLNDATLLIRDLWAMDAVGATPFDWIRDPLVGAPEGIPRPPAIAYQSALHQLALWLPGEIIGWTLALNLYLLASFVLAGFLTFLLLDRLPCGFLAALFGGWVFAFSPERVWIMLAGHAGRAQNWVLPLTALCLVRARETRSMRWAALSGLSVAVAAFFDAYLGLFALVLALVFATVDVILGRHRSSALRRAAVVAAAASLPLLVPLAVWGSSRDEVSISLRRSTRDIELFDARLIAYVIPSERHPVFGSRVAAFYERNPEARNFDENTLFFGYTTMVLASVTLASVAVSRRGFTDTQRFAATAAAALALTGFLASRAHLVDVAGVQIPGPPLLLGEITTAFRAYARFGVLVGLGLVILASLALGRLVRRAGTVVGLVLFTLVVFELAPGRLEIHRTDRPPPEVEWLARHPGGMVANYPLYEAYGLPDGTPIATMRARSSFFQMHHRHRLFDGAKLDGDRPQELRIVVSDLESPATPPILAARGVLLVVVHDAVYRSLGVRPPVLERPPFKLRERFGSTRIYALRSSKPATVPLALRERRGFEPPDGAWRWMHRSGFFTILARGPARVRIDLAARSTRRPTRLRLFGPEGEEYGARRVGVETSSIRFGGLRVRAGENLFRLVAGVPPAPISKDDPRLATVFVSPIDVGFERRSRNRSRSRTAPPS